MRFDHRIRQIEDVHAVGREPEPLLPEASKTHAAEDLHERGQLVRGPADQGQLGRQRVSRPEPRGGAHLIVPAGMLRRGGEHERMRGELRLQMRDVVLDRGLEGVTVETSPGPGTPVRAGRLLARELLEPGAEGAAQRRGQHPVQLASPLAHQTDPHAQELDRHPLEHLCLVPSLVDSLAIFSRAPHRHTRPDPPA